MSESYSVCDTPVCPNEGRVANHPRSDTPNICGVCGRDVRILFADKKKEELIE